MKVDLNKLETFNDCSDDLEELKYNDLRISKGDFNLGVSFNGLDLDVSVDIDIFYDVTEDKDERGNTYNWGAKKDRVSVLFNEAYLDGDCFGLDWSKTRDLEEAIEMAVKYA